MNFSNITIATGTVSFFFPAKVSLSNAYIAYNNSEYDKGIHLSSTGPISVIVQYGAAGVYPAYPMHIFQINQYVYYTASSYVILPSMQNEILLVGTEDGTKVMVTPAANVLVPSDVQSPGSSQELLHAGATKNITLNRLQTILFGSSGFADLTGTSIVSDKPLMVISSQNYAYNNEHYCEHVQEQIPPTVTWGKTYLVRSYTGNNVHTYFSIVSSLNNTAIQHNCGGNMMKVYLTTAGSSKKVSLFADENCYIESNRPILISQVMTSGEGSFGDPAASVISPTDHYTNEVVFTSHLFNQSIVNITYDFLNIVTQAKDTIVMDGYDLNIVWEPIIDFFGSIVGYSTSVSVTIGIHDIYSVNGTPFHILVYGYSESKSAAYSFSAIIGILKQLGKHHYKHGEHLCSEQN